HLQEEIAALLFEAVRELLFNAVKYAGVEAIDVEVREERDLLHVVVSDHGRGFEPAQAAHRRGGYGLFSVRERLAAVGGALRVDSVPGRGTRVELQVPARPSGPPAAHRR